jgi:hypothetical protein
MKRRFISISALALLAAGAILFPSFTAVPTGVFVDKQQEQKAFALLNKVRHDPNSYTERFGFSLKGISPKPDLRWNDSLCAVAERRALDMANRGFFEHVDPDGYGINYYINKSTYTLTPEQLKHKKASDFDAYEGGAPSGEVAIKNIIIDYDKIGDEGRKLLLGIGDLNATLVDCGIAFVHGSGSTKYKSYTVVIISKNNGPPQSDTRF